MTKKSFLTNIKNSDNLKDYENKKEVIKRKILTININKEDLKIFREDAFNYYKDLDKLIYFSYTNYFKICLENVYLFFQDKYGIALPTPEYMKFYKKRGRTNGTALLYNHVFDSTEAITFLLNEDQLTMYYSILHTYYLNEKRDLASYSATFFFYDFLKIISEIKPLKYF